MFVRLSEYVSGQFPPFRVSPSLFQDIFLLCFAVDNHVSYGNVRDTWIEEIRHHCPKTPVILVGTKVSRSLARSFPSIA